MKPNINALKSKPNHSTEHNLRGEKRFRQDQGVLSNTNSIALSL